MTDVIRLQVEADRRIALGDLVDGLAILGHLRLWPTYGASDEDETKRILSRLTAPPDEVERLLAAGADLDIDRVLAEIAAGS